MILAFCRLSSSAFLMRIVLAPTPAKPRPTRKAPDIARSIFHRIFMARPSAVRHVLAEFKTLRSRAFSTDICRCRCTAHPPTLRKTPLHAHRPVGTVAGLIDRGSLRRLSGGRHEDPASLPICVASCVVVLPFVMRFYLGGFGVKRQVQEALLACALGVWPPDRFGAYELPKRSMIRGERGSPTASRGD